jgi:hypothetical protein
MTWSNTETAAQQLGVTAEKLRKLKRKGYLKHGFHWRSQSSPDAKKPRMQFNVERLQELFNTERHKWKTYTK